MLIREAVLEDIEQIMEVYRASKEYMVASGNPNQWVNGYPTREIIESDISRQQFFVCEENGQIQGAFMFFVGEEPTYQIIENGSWKNEEPYGTIHRLGSNGKRKGIFEECLAFCRRKHANLRADTHHENKTMQHLLEKNGFERCGIVYMKDGSKRIAYQLTEV